MGCKLSVKASPTTLTVDDDGPADFNTIQEAINAASDGDAVFVRNGVYHENLVVNKSIMLVGEDRAITAIDGMERNQSVVEVTADNVAITGFTVQNSSRATGTSFAGFKVLGNMCDITGNGARTSKIGIFVSSQGSRIANNLVADNGHGIALYRSSETSIEENNASLNTVGISLASNSNDNKVMGNLLMNNYHGMWLSSSHNNSIVENTVANNELLGIELADSSDNKLYHNNFINNPKHVKIDNRTNIWDNSSHGNYWSDYEGKYPDAGEINGSGIWNTPYVINENNKDNFPLIPEFPSLAISLIVMILLLFTAIICKNCNFRNNQSTQCK